MQFSTALVALLSLGYVAATPVSLGLADRANVKWDPAGTYKKDPAKKADYEGKVCDALDRDGCSGGTILGGMHTSPTDGGKQRLTVRPDGASKGDRKEIHVYPDGTASKLDGSGNVVPVRRSPVPAEEEAVLLAERATATWKDPNTYKNDPAKKADYESKACNALDRAGCSGGEILGGEHTSKTDSKDHVTVRPDGASKGQGKDIHVYPDGSASKIDGGNVVNFRSLDVMEDLE